MDGIGVRNINAGLMKKGILIMISFCCLPDVNTFADLERYGYRAYGRFAILQDGTLWVGDLHSSHPRDTKVGWYWAVSDDGTFFFSARGAETDNKLVSGSSYQILRLLITKLRSSKIIE